MSEASKRWRCPYCDGLNDWQNAVCEICGDGKRPDAETPAKEPGFPRTYTPQPRGRTEEPAGRAEPAEAKRVAFAPPPSATEPPKKKKKGGVWIAVVVVALGALGGRFLADSFVNSVEANRPSPTPPAFVETVAPDKSSEEGTTARTEGEKAPTEAARPSLWSALRAQQSPSPLARVASATDIGNGLATLEMQFADRHGPYTVYCLYLGDDPDSASPLHYRLDDDRFLPALRFRSIDLVSNRYESPATLPVIPGGYTAFLVSCYTEDLSAQTWFVSEPCYFGEVREDIPLTIADVRLCGFAQDGDRYDYLNSLRGSDDHSVPQPEAFALDSAARLNESAAMAGLSLGRKGKYLAYDVAMQLDTSSYDFYSVFVREFKPRLMALLTGPGFCVADQAHEMSFDQGYCRMGTWKSVFDNNFNLVNEIGGYPPGDYTLDFFVYGRKLYTLRFTLN